MLYVTSLERTADGSGYPYTVPAVAVLGRFEFTAPITLFCGDNGSGKSTLMELIAGKLTSTRIGEGQLERRRGAELAGRGFTLGRRRSPKRSFFFTAEDFSAYIAWVSRTKDEARREIARIDALTDMPDKEYAAMPFRHTLEDLEALYASDLALRSHGEGFLDFFAARLKPGGVYLLDEPEGALSYENQYALSLMITDAARDDECQFILATHSPVITAIPGAQLVELTADGFHETSYEELRSIAFLELFFQRRDRLMRS